MSRKKSLLLSTISCLIFTLAIVAPAFAGGVQRVLMPAHVFFGGSFTNSCYNGGEGEDIINLTGYVQINVNNIDGGYMLHISGFGGGNGTGETSGDTYQINGAFQQVVVNDGATATLIHNLRLVSQDHDNSFQFVQRSHVTVTPSGQIIVNPDPELLETICSWE